jgi:hypothetical protein
VGEAEAGTEDEGLAPRVGESAIRRSRLKAPVSTARCLALPRWFGGSTSLVDHRHGAIGESVEPSMALDFPRSNAIPCKP